jgi:hypothetical protein
MADTEVKTVEIPESRLHTAFNRDGKWFVQVSGEDVELSPELVERMHVLKREKSERDQQTKERAHNGVRRLHLALVEKDASGDSTIMHQLARGVIQAAFKLIVKDNKEVLKSLKDDDRSAAPMLKLLIGKLVEDSENTGKVIGEIITDQILALADACESGVMCKNNVRATEIVQFFVNWSPSAAVKKLDMARASDM